MPIYVHKIVKEEGDYEGKRTLYVDIDDYCRKCKKKIEIIDAYRLFKDEEDRGLKRIQIRCPHCEKFYRRTFLLSRYRQRDPENKSPSIGRVSMVIE